MIKTYQEYTSLNESSLRNSAIIGLISVSLLSSCRLFHHHKNTPKTEIEAQPQEVIDNYIPSAPKTKLISSDIVQNFGKLPWPTERALIYQRFGNYKKGKIEMKNDGIFIKTNENAKIRSVFQGVVTKVFDVCGEKTIIITHNNYYSVYSGFKKLIVKPGTKVNEKTILGYSKNEISFQFWKAKGTKAIPINPEKVLIHYNVGNW